MSLPTFVRNATAACAHCLPPFRGLGTLCNKINSLTLGMGADSLATAKMRDGTTLLVDLTTRTEKWAFYSGQYDGDLISMIVSLLDHDSYFLDVGGNIGFYTVAVASSYRAHKGEGRVIAFEPFASNYQRLESNAQRNALEDYCELYNVGLSDERKECEITLREDFEGGSETGNAAIPVGDEKDKNFRRAPIMLEMLDAFWQEHQYQDRKIDVIKVDIEGHEDYFFRGARTVIEAQRPTILMEVNKPYYQAREVELDSLFLPLIPPDYVLFRPLGSGWTTLQSLHDCQALDNALLVPREKLDLPRYERFRKLADT
ncbi:FkbM family methyltransferase [Blastopirellula retiformator]|uniref:Methyltransferase FkbM domain-containing protein n=1 Tax=Blastopirellula retiformator TaxID=2527970 RepID=A0A5C5UYV4_9BACT|nr:FkbM family methyltransferase [Blastopirellula retiformator]TWT31534.1 hypothetical protein Enr8_34560 [Blastopirellula retiformator]